MDGIIGDRILRCSAGHLFTAGQGSRTLGSVHLGPKRFMRCPVDGRWRLMSNVDSRSLSDADRLQAAQFRG